jgi:hypothetical protein
VHINATSVLSTTTMAEYIGVITYATQEPPPISSECNFLCSVEHQRKLHARNKKGVHWSNFDHPGIQRTHHA